MIYTLRIDNWHPRRLNELLAVHWSKAGQLKKADQQLVAAMSLNARIPRATGKRRVRLHLILAPRQRGADPDAYWKSLLDALTSCGLLVDDNRQHVELTMPTFARGKRRETIITLEDLEVCDG